MLPLFRPNLDVTFKGWMGGATYLENLARVLSLLPENERPQILIVTDGTIETPVVRALFGTDAVEGVFAPDGAPIALKPELFKVLVDGTNPNRAKIATLLAEPSAVFPVFRTMFEPVNALHWIPDFQHKHLPEMFDAAELARRDADFATMATARAYLLLSSHAAADDLKRFYPQATVRTFIWPFVSALDLQLTPAADPRPKYALPDKYLLAPNQFWKHKNHMTAFAAIKAARDHGRDVTLACTGKASDFRHPAYFDELKSYVESGGLGEAIRFLGVVPQNDLLQLIRFSAAVVQPSLFEGWSTVVEDAKAIGRPLILSDLAVHKEQCEGLTNAHFFKRGDAASLAGTLSRLWPTLAPGPDRVAEQQAVERRVIRENDSARAFVKILDAICPQRATSNG
ncbi:MAG: glycosyltransferase [Rhodobacteraceae bacterium]|nr:glycosyltransferase [Paracoccaceae bacterium]